MCECLFLHLVFNYNPELILHKTMKKLYDRFSIAIRRFAVESLY